MITARNVTAFMHAKSFTALLFVVACVSSFVAWQRGAVVHIPGNLGWGLPSANFWLPFGWVSAAVNLVANLLVAVTVVFINRRFNVLRSLTALVASMYFVMQMALPSVFGQLYGGTVLALVILMCTMLLFSVYGDSQGQRRVFLIFCLLGAGVFTQIAYLFYVPMLMVGCVQMRVMSLRSFLAMLLGFITPAWILFGFGIVTPADIHWRNMTMLWSLFDAHELVQTMVVTAFTIIMGVVFVVANLMKILSYNSRVRAMNGFLAIMFGATALLTLIDFNNFAFYIPLLNILTAYQVGHFFTYRRQRRSYIAVLLLVLVYVALYVWALHA